ncbi:MAG: hypothetical protein PHT38_01080 [Halothiobacillus sp.]|jgi:hypothetical protein|nr:hypothetical protein [Halothiobacillus sp.]
MSKIPYSVRVNASVSGLIRSRNIKMGDISKTIARAIEVVMEMSDKRLRDLCANATELNRPMRIDSSIESDLVTALKARAEKMDVSQSLLIEIGVEQFAMSATPTAAMLVVQDDYLSEATIGVWRSEKSAMGAKTELIDCLAEAASKLVDREKKKSAVEKALKQLSWIKNSKAEARHGIRVLTELATQNTNPDWYAKRIVLRQIPLMD